MAGGTTDPKRFQASKATLLMDAFMTHFIKVGGALVIVTVFGIFVFILSQIVPLFRGARVHEKTSVPTPPGDYAVMGADEWTELPFLLRGDGTFVFVDIAAGGAASEERPAPLGEKTVTAIGYRPQQGSVTFGTADGGFVVGKVKYTGDFSSGQRRVRHSFDWIPFQETALPGVPVTEIASGETDSAKLIATVQQSQEGQTHLSVSRVERKKSLIGSGQWKVANAYDLSAFLTAPPRKILVTSSADAVIALLENGDVEYFFLTSGGFELRQKFRPFGDVGDGRVASMDFLLGDVSLVFTSPQGNNRVFSLFPKPGETVRTFGQTKEFPPLSAGAAFFSQSLRNKSFLLGAGRRASLRHGTTEVIRWETDLPFDVRMAVLGGKYESMLFLDNRDRLHVYGLEDPHPETSLPGLFGRIWYEGATEPKYEWQSTGGSDEFEPKLSLVPLLVGTLKGTLYAMIFAVPIALLAALYTSQFLHPDYRGVIKPTMEIMASLPSVVLGFLAALWLAPLIETRVPSILAVSILLPAGAYFFGWLWSGLPVNLRRRVAPGCEFLAFLPLLVLLVWAGWTLGPVLEQWFFYVTDPVSGEKVADFRRWWPHATGTNFEQRNSLVVGFMMGFAVIPIIFTITEDALSNVPATLRSGSLALGASRWQTALHIVLPTASAGIFSALMIGLGRAVGETMIVVMATGNTPLTEWNIFSGMRTLSANIAVELPEAPHHGTLYRSLFLGAMVLFVLTFFVNTLAEILRQHLREKYKTV